MRRWSVAIVAWALAAQEAAAQGYQVRLDSRVQSVAFRGVAEDSVLRSDVEIGPTGGFVTSDGFAVACAGGVPYCRYYRPGPVRRGGPWVTTADATVWGLGVSGLSFHGTARVGVDAGDADVWPGTNPAVQLLDGYFAYTTDFLTLEAGRTSVFSRLGYTGFDGGRASLRALGGMASATLYGGWGLARGVALPVTSPALNPLDDYQPRERQLVAGVDAAVRSANARGRVTYEREVDPRSDNFVSERVGVAAHFEPAAGISLSGGADYDLAFGQWGTAEAVLGVRVLDGRLDGAVGARRYQPYFDLFTIWGVFSPVGYDAAFGSVSFRAARGLEVRAKGETYDYRPAEAATPLVNVEDGGWRASVGGTYRPKNDLVVDAEYHAEFGSGAASVGVQGTARWNPTDGMTLGVHGGALKRPLEFRFAESNVWLIGAELDYQLTSRLRLDASVTRYDERRERPDAAAFDWDQFRISAGMRLTLGGATDQGLPPSILRIPMRSGDTP